jgi:hypothetical protein
MIVKLLIAAAAVASTLVAVAPEQAKADVDFHVGVNLAHPGFYPGYGYGYQPVYPAYGPSKISCYQGKQTVRWSGFFKVQAIDCHGPTYRYNARKAGNFYQVTVSAWSGQIVKVKPFAIY